MRQLSSPYLFVSWWEEQAFINVSDRELPPLQFLIDEFLHAAVVGRQLSWAGLEKNKWNSTTLHRAPLCLLWLQGLSSWVGFLGGERPIWSIIQGKTSLEYYTIWSIIQGSIISSLKGLLFQPSETQNWKNIDPLWLLLLYILQIKITVICYSTDAKSGLTRSSDAIRSVWQ